MEEVTEIVGVGCKDYPYTTVLVGIESGSPNLIKSHMSGKPWPFKPSEWPKIVEKGFGLLNDHHWVPTGMLILGLPGEREEDVYETIALVEKLKPYKSVFAPFLFEAKSALNNEKTFKVEDLESHHLELIKTVFNHNTYWGKRLIVKLANNSPLMKALLPIASLAVGFGVERAYKQLFDEIVPLVSFNKARKMDEP